MKLYLVRHGDPIYNPDSLTPLGERQAEAVSKSYPDFFEVLKTLNVKVDIYEDR